MIVGRYLFRCVLACLLTVGVCGAVLAKAAPARASLGSKQKPGPAPQELPELVARIKPSVVTIIVYGADGKRTQQGTGFFIAPRRLVTNRHVVLGAHRAEIKLLSGTVLPITNLIGEDEKLDLVLLSTDLQAKGAPPLSFSEAIPQEGERIVVVGSPLGLEQTVSEGIVSSIRDVAGLGGMIQITAAISPGSSGSPVVDMSGRVIGVATSQEVGGQSLNFAVPSSRVRELKAGKLQNLAAWSAERLAGPVTGDLMLGYEALFAINCDEARSRFRKAGDAGQVSHEILLELVGHCYRKLGRFQDEVDAYKEIVRINPNNEVAHYNLGLAYGKLGMHQDEIDSYKSAIRIKPDDADSYSNLGVAYHKTGEYDDAIEAYKQAIRFKPESPMAHYNLGLAYFRFDRYKEAIDSYKQAIRFQPDLPEAHYNLGLAYLLSGKKSSALDEYTVLRELDKKQADDLFNKIYE